MTPEDEKDVLDIEQDIIELKKRKVDARDDEEKKDIDQQIQDLKQKIEDIKEKDSMKEKIIEIEEEVRVGDYILEAGDRIEVLAKIEENTTLMSRNHVTVQDVIYAINSKFDDIITMTNQKIIPNPQWLYTGATYSFFLAEGSTYTIDGVAENRVPISMSITKSGEYVKTIYLEDGLSGILSQIK